MNENSSPGNTSLDNNNSIIQQQLAEARELSKKSLKQLSTEGKALFREASDNSSDTDSSALSPEQQLAQQERLSDEILANYSIYNTGAETNLHGDIWNAPFKMLPIFETPPFSNDTISCQMTFFHRAHGLSLLIKFPSTYPNDTNLPGSIPSFVVQNLNGYVKLSELTLQNFTKAMDTIAIASNGTECVYLCIEEFNQLMHSMIGGRIDQTQQKSWIESLKSGDAIFAIYQDGCEYNAHIVRVGRTACRVQWDDFEEEYSTVSFQNITKVSNILKQHEPSETTITLPKTVDINILLQKQKTPQPTSNFSTTSKLSKLSRSSRSSRSNKQGETKTELIDSNATDNDVESHRIELKYQKKANYLFNKAETHKHEIRKETKQQRYLKAKAKYQEKRKSLIENHESKVISMKNLEEYQKKIRRISKTNSKKEKKRLEEYQKLEMQGKQKKRNIIDKHQAELESMDKEWNKYKHSRKSKTSSITSTTTTTNNATSFRKTLASSHIISGGDWPLLKSKRKQYGLPSYNKPSPRHFSACFAWNGKLYLHGGINNSTGNVSKQLWCMYPRSAKWSCVKIQVSEKKIYDPLMRKMQTFKKSTKQFYGHTATVLSNRSCLLIGKQGCSILNKFRNKNGEVTYSFSTPHMMNSSGMPIQLRYAHHTATRIGNRIFLFGGEGDQSLSCYSFEEKISTNTVWLENELENHGNRKAVLVQGTPPDYSLSHHGAANVQGSLAIFGGICDGHMSAKLYLLSSSLANSCISTSSLNEIFTWSQPTLAKKCVAPQCRSDFSMHSCDGKIYIFGGSNKHGGAHSDLHSAQLIEENDENESTNEKKIVVKWMKHKIELIDRPGHPLLENQRRRRKTNSCVLNGKLYMFHGDSQDSRTLNNKTVARRQWSVYQSQYIHTYGNQIGDSNWAYKNKSILQAARNPPPLILYIGGEHFSIPSPSITNDFQQLFLDSLESSNPEEDTFTDVTLTFSMFRRHTVTDEWLTAPDLKYACHKCMLASRSSHFYSRLNNSTNTYFESGPFHSTDAIQCLLMYLYTGGGFDTNKIDLICRQNEFNVLDIMRLTIRWWGPNDPLYQHVVTLYASDCLSPQGKRIQHEKQSILLEEHECRIETQQIQIQQHQQHHQHHQQHEHQQHQQYPSPQIFLSEMFVMNGPSLPLGYMPFSDLQVEQLNAEGEKEIVASVHRCILAARCSVFQTMLRLKMKESNSGVVTMTDDSISATKCLLKFIYADTFKKPTSTVTMLSMNNEVKTLTIPLVPEQKEKEKEKEKKKDIEREGETKENKKQNQVSTPESIVGLGLGLNEENVTDVYVVARRYMLKRLREVCGVKILNVFDIEDVESVLGLWCWSMSISDDRMSEAAGWYLSLNFSVREVQEKVVEFELDEEQKKKLATCAHINLL